MYYVLYVFIYNSSIPSIFFTSYMHKSISLYAAQSLETKRTRARYQQGKFENQKGLKLYKQPAVSTVRTVPSIIVL